MLLRDHVWAFSKKFATLSALGDASEVTPWEYQFQLPPDCARIGAVTVEDNLIEFERVGDRLHTMEDEIDLRYHRNFSDVDDGFAFPDDFAEVLASFLAAELAMSMTQTQALRDTYLGEYQERLAAARHNGAVERNDKPVASSSWMDAHDSGYPDTDPRLRGLSGY
jgi:hypothetical protein